MILMLELDKELLYYFISLLCTINVTYSKFVWEVEVLDLNSAMRNTCEITL